MAKIKENSVRNENKNQLANDCPVSYLMNKIGGHWKPIILFHLMGGTKRYSELKRAIPAVTEKMLIQHLKQLEADGLILRKAEPVVPPFVTYKLSLSGQALKPALMAMADWGVRDMKKLKKAATQAA